MLRVGKLIRVRPEYEERYVIIHKHVWPEVLDRIRKSHIRNYSIFLLNGMLFSFYEYTGNNYGEDMKAVADDVTMDWWKLTDPMQEPLSNINKGDWWAETESIQHFDEFKKDYTEVKRRAYTAEILPGSESFVKDHFRKFDATMPSLFSNSNIQNHNTFIRDHKLYVYLEYAGKDFQKDDGALNSKSEVVNWNLELGKHLIAEWKEMHEVFHTD